MTSLPAVNSLHLPLFDFDWFVDEHVSYVIVLAFWVIAAIDLSTILGELTGDSITES